MVTGLCASLQKSCNSLVVFETEKRNIITSSSSPPPPPSKKGSRGEAGSPFQTSVRCFWQEIHAPVRWLSQHNPLDQILTCCSEFKCRQFSCYFQFSPKIVILMHFRSRTNEASRMPKIPAELFLRFLDVKALSGKEKKLLVRTDRQTDRQTLCMVVKRKERRENKSISVYVYKSLKYIIATRWMRKRFYCPSYEFLWQISYMRMT